MVDKATLIWQPTVGEFIELQQETIKPQTIIAAPEKLHVYGIAGKESINTGLVFMLGGPPANGKSTLVESDIIDELYLWDTNINGRPRLVLKQIDGTLEIIDIKLCRDFLRKAGR